MFSSDGVESLVRKKKDGVLIWGEIPSVALDCNEREEVYFR